MSIRARTGAHHGAIKAAILVDGARIAGGNPGNTLFGKPDSSKASGHGSHER